MGIKNIPDDAEVQRLLKEIMGKTGYYTLLGNLIEICEVNAGGKLSYSAEACRCWGQRACLLQAAKEIPFKK